MKFDDLDSMMRVYETSHDYCVLPNIWMVARLDGKGFTKLTKREKFEKPFDINFSNIMRKVTHSLIENTGFNITYGYTQSDEISLLFALDETTFGRKLRKMNSTLAGHASAVASLELGSPAVFDCRICELPTVETVQDYFSWRQSDAHRNALIGYCYWHMRDQGMSARAATSLMNGWGAAAQNEYLFQQGINYNNVEPWHKKGIGFYFESYLKEGFNPKTKEKVVVERKGLVINDNLPLKEEYRYFIKRKLNV